MVYGRSRMRTVYGSIRRFINSKDAFLEQVKVPRRAYDDAAWNRRKYHLYCHRKKIEEVSI